MTIKRIVLLLGAIILAAGLPVFSVAAENGVTITVEAPAEVLEGDSFVARVNVNNVTDLYAAEYTVSFNETVLELVNVTAGEVGGAAFPVMHYNADVYKVVQAVANITDPVSGSGYLAELHFNVIGSIGDTSDIDLIGGMLANADAQEIAATWTGASVEVVDRDPPAVTTNAASAVTHDSATLNGDLDSLGDYTEVRVRFQWGTTAAYGNNTPWQAMTSAGPLGHQLTDLEPETQYHFRVQVETVLPASTVSVNGTDMIFTTDAVPCIPGDANEDGVVNVLDLALTARIIAGLEDVEDWPCADANQDGTVNVLDLAKIARIIAGLENSTA